MGISYAVVTKVKELVDSKEYGEALDLLEGQDIYQTLNPQFLRCCGEVYLENNRFYESRKALVTAHTMAPEANRVVYDLVYLYLKMGYYTRAQRYFDIYMFYAVPEDVGHYFLQYMINKSKRLDAKMLQPELIRGCEEQYTDEWAFELALLYASLGKQDKVKEECIRIMATFKKSPYVELAKALKQGEYDITSSHFSFPLMEADEDLETYKEILEIEEKQLEKDELKVHPPEAVILQMEDDDGSDEEEKPKRFLFGKRFERKAKEKPEAEVTEEKPETEETKEKPEAEPPKEEAKDKMAKVETEVEIPKEKPEAKGTEEEPEHKEVSDAQETRNMEELYVQEDVQKPLPEEFLPGTSGKVAPKNEVATEPENIPNSDNGEPEKGKKHKKKEHSKKREDKSAQTLATEQEPDGDVAAFIASIMDEVADIEESVEQDLQDPKSYRHGDSTNTDSSQRTNAEGGIYQPRLFDIDEDLSPKERLARLMNLIEEDRRKEAEEAKVNSTAGVAESLDMDEYLMNLVGANSITQAMVKNYRNEQESDRKEH